MKPLDPQHQTDDAAYLAERDRALDALGLASVRVDKLPTKDPAETALGIVVAPLAHMGLRSRYFGYALRGTSVSYPLPLNIPELVQSTLNVYDPSGRLPVRRTPQPWRSLNYRQEIHAVALTLPSLGATVAFTANLRPDIEAKARTQPSTGSFLLDEIGRHTLRLLGRRVLMWFCLEEADHKRRLHLHGVAQIELNERELFRKAVRLACGEWEEHRQYQVKTDPEPPDAGWTHYCLKRSIWLVKDGPQDQKHGRRITGKHYAASKRLKDEAQALYTEARQLIMRSSPDDVPDDTQVKIDLSSNENEDVAEKPLPSSEPLTHEANAPSKEKTGT